MKNLESDQGPRPLRLCVTVGLAALFLTILLGGLRSVSTTHADPGILYVDGASGQDIPTCGTTSSPCETISYTLNGRAIGSDTIRVAQGVYTENLTVDKQVTLEGGYEAVGWTRSITQYETIIDGFNSRTVEGDWDGNSVRYPFVTRDGSIYKMWYTGRDLYNVWRIGYLTSTDGIDWTRTLTEPVLDLGSGDAWDSENLEAPFVIKDGPASYKMWYSGHGPGGTAAIGYATSTDGINWTKYAGNPVLDIGTEYWNNRFTHSPSVIYEDGLYKMWLRTTGENGDDLTPYMAYATSLDGITWTMAITNPLFSYDPAHYWEDGSIWGPNVLHMGGSYQMWYAAWGSGEVHTGYATSPDGWTWTKYNGGVEPVLSGTGGEWDEGDAGDPCVLYASGVYTMWYSNETSIGVATSTDSVTWTKYVNNPVLSPGTPGQWGQPAVAFVSGSSGSVFDGFTVRNGEAEYGGGVLVNEGAEAIIRNCTVVSNTAQNGGGGIAIQDAHATVVANVILSNTVLGGGGGGILVDNAVVSVTNNVVASNMGLNMAGDGDGICAWGDDSNARIINNTVVFNSAEGIQVFDAGVVLARNNIIYGNDGGIHNYDSGPAVTSDHNAFWNNGWDYANVTPGTGDISGDPLFVDAASGDYHLQADSPCINAGTSTDAPNTDIEGTPRDAVPDIGAYEWGKYRVFLPLTLRTVGQ